MKTVPPDSCIAPPAAGERAVVLLSGGLDSATVLAWAGSQGYRCHTLTVDYGQHARTELAAAAALAAAFRVEAHHQVRVGLDSFGGSALVEKRPVPAAGEARMRHGIPETYVPARNTIFLSLALGLAETLGAHTILIGANSLDYSGYPDCRPSYLEAFNRLAALAVAEGAAGGRPIRALAPLMEMGKGEIVALGLKLGLDYRLTVSCYQPTPEGAACGRCESCVLRLKGFAAVGRRDPIPYAAGTEDPCRNESIAPRAAMRPGRKARGGTPTAGVLEVHRGRRGPRNAEDGDAATLECTTHSCTGPEDPPCEESP